MGSSFEKRIGACVFASCAWLAVCQGCSSSPEETGNESTVNAPVIPASPGATGGAGSGMAAPPVTGGAGMAAGAAGAPGIGAAGSAPLIPMGGAGGMPASAAGANGGTAGAAGDGAPMQPMQPLEPVGPEDGDPGQPVIAISGIACGPNPSLPGLTTFNAQVGGRDVHVAYPCNKHKGAPVVFILNLHGTMPDETLKGYQVAYFSANNQVNTHNLITVAPKSVVSQWTNGDNGQDEPHLMEVIDWVYTTFADFDIRAMWVSGHSWGAMYSSGFACKPELADKVRGAVLESGTGMNPACASRISVISSAAEMDIGPVINQGQVPAGHGCGASMENMLGNNVETYWPDCDPGFVHANYYMLGKEHATNMDVETVESAADWIKLSRQ